MNKWTKIKNKNEALFMKKIKHNGRKKKIKDRKKKMKHKEKKEKIKGRKKLKRKERTRKGNTKII